MSEDTFITYDDLIYSLNQLNLRKIIIPSSMIKCTLTIKNNNDSHQFTIGRPVRND